MSAPATDFDQLWNYDDPAGTELKFRELLPAVAVDAGRHVELLTQIARTQGLQRQFEAAHATLDEAERLLKPDLPRARVRLLLERGRVFNSARQPEQAVPLFLAAWETAQAAGEDGYAVDAAHMLGIAAPPEQRLDWNQQALALAERSAAPGARRWLGALYNNLGWTLHDQGAYAQALALFERALAWRQTQAGQAREVRIARWCVARVLRSLGRLEEALAAQRAYAAELAEAGEAADGYGQEEIGECLLALGQAEAARPHFAAAYARLSQDPWLAAHEPERLARLQALGAAEP